MKQRRAVQMLKKAILQQQMTYPLVSAKDCRDIFDPSNPRCAYHGYVGNEEAVRIAIRIGKKAFDSRIDMGLACGTWHEPIWACNREFAVRILLTGSKSTGKTTSRQEVRSVSSVRTTTPVILRCRGWKLMPAPSPNVRRFWRRSDRPCGKQEFP